MIYWTNTLSRVKFLLRSLLFLTIIFAILLLSVLLWLKTESGIAMVTDFVSRYVEQNTVYKLKIKDVDFALPLGIKIQKLTFSDNEAEFFIAENFCVNIVPSLLWLWEVNVKDITAEQLILTRLPNSNLNSRNKDLTNKKQLGFVPNIKIKNITIKNFILSPELSKLSEDISFSFVATLNFYSQDQTVRFWTDLTANPGVNGSADKKLPLINGAVLNTEGQFDIINNNLIIEQVKLSSSYLNLVGNFNINFLENSLAGSANYDSSILEYLLSERKSLKSLFKGTINFTGLLTAPHVATSGEVFFEDASQNYFQLPKLNWQSDLIVNKDGAEGKFSFEVASIKGSGEVGKNASKIYLKDFTVKGRNLSGKGNLSFDNKGQGAIGEFTVNSNNIYELKNFFPLLEKGQMDIKVGYKKTDTGKEQLDILGKAQHLSTSIANCDFIDFSLSLKDFERLIISHADVKVRSLASNYGTVKSFTFQAKEAGQAIDFTTHLESIDPYQINLNTYGQLKGNYLQEPGAGATNLEIINKISGTIGKIKIATPEAIKLNFGKDFSIAVPNLIANDGKLNLDLKGNSSKINATLKVSKFPLAIISNVLPKVFDQSLISGSVSLNGSAQSPFLDSKLEIYNINLAAKGSIPPILTLSSHVENNKLSLKANIEQEKRELASFKLQAPCNFQLSPFEFSILKKGNLNASLTAAKEINILSLMPLPVGHKLQGYLDGEIRASGHIEALVVNGTMNLTQGEYKYQEYGVKLKDISGKITAKNNSISILEFNAYDNYSNSLAAKGDLLLNKDLPFKLFINTKKFSLINSPYLQGEMAGNLAVLGNNKKALARGNFDLGPMEIKVPEHFSDDIPAINVVRTINSGKIIYETENKQLSYVLELDVGLNAKQQVYVRGRGVNTLLAGNLRIAGNASNPNIFGELRSVRGRYQEFGKFLTVKEGILTFSGPISPSPYLNIVGATVVGDTEIRLVLGGSIFKPDIRIESTPSLSQQDALSLLLFGKNPDSISPSQAIGLANGMRKLSGYGGGFDPVGLGRKILGVDDISIKEDDNTESSYVGVGKYLTDKVYLEIDQGNEVFGTKTKIEVELTPKISLEAITGEKGNSSFGINWRVNY